MLLAALTAASSCQQEEVGLNQPQPTEVTISASAAETKTAMEGNAVVWEDGDEIALVFTHPTEPSYVGTFSTQIDGGRAAQAKFKGKLSPEVTAEGAYDDSAYAVYPASAVASDGSVIFTLPSDQTPRADGTFAAGLNLSSALVSLADIREDGQTEVRFRNALSVLRLTPAADVTKVTLTGTVPFAGKASFVVNAEDGGRLVVDTEAEWAESDKSMNVTIMPATGAECFDGKTPVNLLVLPGSHTGLVVDITFKEYGNLQKTATANFVLAPSKFYTLNLNADSEKIIEEITDNLDSIEGTLAGLEDRLNRIETIAGKISLLVDQIQSVALMSEYLDNAVYAPYAQQMYNKLTVGIKSQYIVRPAEAMQFLLDLCKDEGNLSDVLSAVVYDRKGNLRTMTVSDAVLEGDVLTVDVSPEAVIGTNHWLNPFYEGDEELSLALQISDGNTEILSDFANLVPKSGAVMNITRTNNVPVLKGASFSMPFKYAAEDFSKCKFSVASAGFSSVPTVSASNGNGWIQAFFDENDELSNKSITVTMTYEDTTDSQTITFADGGRFEVETSGDVDYIGGDVLLTVVQNSFGSHTSELRGGDWIYQTYTGSNSSLTVKENTSTSPRTASVVYTIRNGNLTYTKSVTVTQNAYGSPVDESRYYHNGDVVTINSATVGYTPLNIVIVGDGYQKKDLMKGGRFERSARFACEAFFGVEPYSSFRDRFRVVMVTYESKDEGLSLQDGAQKDTYFSSYYKGSGNTYVNLPGGDYTSVVNVVKTDLGWSDDATYYRTIVIMLINTSEGIGSNAAVYRAAYGNTSALGEPYASMALAMVTANNTETNNLIRHEAGGHAFGRLGDEYPTKTWGSDVNGMHDIGWYRNVTVDRNKWNWDEFIGLAGYEDVTYYQPNSTYWCPIDHTKHNSIMYNNTNKYNAPCRQIIYERIIRQTESADAYSWNRFLDYDKRNIAQ